MSELHPLLQTFVPDDHSPFDHRRANHLLNRAAFGGTPAEIERVRRQGPVEAVEWLLDFADAPAAGDDRPDLSASERYPRTFNALQAVFKGKSERESRPLRQEIIDANRKSLAELSHWWLRRMANGLHPLQEKLTLFWHGHFTTSAAIEWSAYLIWQQNEMLRRHAAGNFHALLHAVARDPAMLSYLDNAQNHRQQPNENFARELLELFTLGIGKYSEQDVREAARAFTGWTHDGEQFVFDASDHDAGEKLFLGRRGNFDGGDILDEVARRPECAAHVVSRLLKFFVGDPVDSSLVSSLAELFREKDLELRPVLRTILTSRAFYDEAVIGRQIKSPIHLVVGTARLLEIELPSDSRLRESLLEMGQAPFYPPDVNGWPSGKRWITTHKMFLRHNTAAWLAEHVRAQNVELEGPSEELVERWLIRLIGHSVEPARKQLLIEALGGEPRSQERLQNMLELIVALSEYQMC